MWCGDPCSDRRGGCHRDRYCGEGDGLRRGHHRHHQDGTRDGLLDDHLVGLRCDHHGNESDVHHGDVSGGHRSGDAHDGLHNYRNDNCDRVFL